MDRGSNKKWSFLICIALTVVTVAVYYHVCSFKFVDYDDYGYVFENTNIRDGITLKTIKWALTTDYFSYWHPLTWLSHALDWQLFGGNPAGHHISNLIFHIANTLLLFIVLNQMTGALWQSAFVAALFALHPLHVESVAWVSERKDVLSTFFWILTMWAYVRYTRQPGIGRYLPVVVFFAFGLMSKPMLVTLPFVLLLLDYWPLNRLRPADGPKHKRAGSKHSFAYLLIEKVPLFVMVLALCIATFIIQKKLGAVRWAGNYNLLIRFANASISYLRYIAKMVWPARLAAFYPHPGQNVSFLFAAISAVLLLAVTIAVLRFAKNRRYLVTGWFWYLGTLVPVIGLVQAGDQAMADRYTYITLTGLFIIIAWGIPDLLGLPEIDSLRRPSGGRDTLFLTGRYKKIAITISALLIILTMSIYTRFHLRYWRNSQALFQHALDVTKDNYVAHLCMSTYTRREGKVGESIYHCQEVLRIKPDDIEVHTRLGDIFLNAGRLDEAIGEYRAFLAKKPDDPNALTTLGIALGRQNKSAEAVKCFKEALRISPNFEAARINLGYALVTGGNHEEAAVHLAEAIRLNPDSAKAHYHFGHVLVQEGKINEAVTHFRKALQLEPNWVEQPLNDLAWILAANKETAIRNPDEAVRLAQRACEITKYQKPELLDTLSVCFAAAGDFDKAVETAQQALQLCRSAGQETFKEEVKNRLILFKAHRPYIEN
jgi:tetratricopeptide (TPR) repeat protein